MCSIYGVVGPCARTDAAESFLHQIRMRACDRGRDAHGECQYDIDHGGTPYHALLGNFRATPTPEVAQAPAQPYYGVVHNGTIANAEALGLQPGEVDSMVLPRILRTGCLEDFALSLGVVKGSYALAVAASQTMYLACTYKPIYYCEVAGNFFFSSMARHLPTEVAIGGSPIKMEPYTAMDVLTRRTIRLLPTAQSYRKAVVIASAGLDSTTVATKLVRDGYQVCLLHFLYGCRAEMREKERISRIARALDCSYIFLHLPYQSMGGNSPLLNVRREIAGPIEGAEYAHEWVPARNFVMVALATAWAEANNYHTVALGNNLEEAGAYPDNEEEFTHLLNQAVPMAVQDGYSLEIVSPVGNLMKHEIVQLGLEIGAPYEHTWSCYRDGDTHCGECGPCFMRKTAFERNGAKDPVFPGEI